MVINTEAEREIMEIVAAGFETGHHAFETYADFKRECPGLGKKGWEYYCELVDLGPAGFYEEFKDHYDFDPMFIAEYGDDEEEFIDSAYHDCSEDELRAMGCFDNLNNTEEDEFDV